MLVSFSLDSLVHSGESFWVTGNEVLCDTFVDDMFATLSGLGWCGTVKNVEKLSAASRFLKKKKCVSTAMTALHT